MKWLTFNAAWVLLLWCSFAGLNWTHPKYSPEALYAFTAWRPFVYRVLPALLMRPWVWIGFSVQSAAVVVSTVGVAGFIAALHFGWRLTLGQMSLVLVGAIPLMLNQSQPYDMLTLALFAGCLAALTLNRLNVFLILFGLAAINRETAFLLTILYVVMRGWDWRVVAQVILFVGIQAVIRVALAGLPGAAFETHWLEHVHDYQTRLGLAVLYLYPLGALLWAVRRGWQVKPLLLRRAALIFTPIIAVMYFVIGFPFEFRVFYEAYTPLALLAVWRI